MANRETTKIGPAYLTAIAALIAAGVPLTAYISGRHSIEVEREKFLAQLQLNYIDRALDPARDLPAREGYLRFLVETTKPSEPLFNWATKEVEAISQARKLRADLSKLSDDLRSTQEELIREQVRRSHDSAIASQKEVGLKSQLASMSRERDRFRVELKEAEERVGVSKNRTADASDKPVITKIEKVESGRSLVIKISGNNFGDEPGLVLSFFGGRGSRDSQLKILEWKNDSIRAEGSNSPLWSEWRVNIMVVTSDKQYAGPVPANL